MCEFDVLVSFDKVLKANKAEIKKVIFNAPATIVFWTDNTKTVVKCREDDIYSKEVGLAMCIVKKYYGIKDFNNILDYYNNKDIPIDCSYCEFLDTKPYELPCSKCINNNGNKNMFKEYKGDK